MQESTSVPELQFLPTQKWFWRLYYVTEHASQSLALRLLNATHKKADNLPWLREQALKSLYAAAAISTRPARETCASCARDNELAFISQQSAFPGSMSKRKQTLVPRELNKSTCERMCLTFIYTNQLAIPAQILPHKRLTFWIEQLIQASAAKWRR